MAERRVPHHPARGQPTDLGLAAFPGGCRPPTSPVDAQVSVVRARATNSEVASGRIVGLNVSTEEAENPQRRPLDHRPRLHAPHHRHRHSRRRHHLTSEPIPNPLTEVRKAGNDHSTDLLTGGIPGLRRDRLHARSVELEPRPHPEVPVHLRACDSTALSPEIKDEGQATSGPVRIRSCSRRISSVCAKTRRNIASRASL
jgi:hypothetical protein